MSGKRKPVNFSNQSKANAEKKTDSTPASKGYNNTDEVNDDFISERRNETAGDERDRDGDDDAKEYAAQADDTSPRTC